MWEKENFFHNGIKKDLMPNFSTVTVYGAVFFPHPKSFPWFLKSVCGLNNPFYTVLWKFILKIHIPSGDAKMDETAQFWDVE